jgi:hypothetical protein
VAGPHAALAELGHLDADPARVGPVDVDGLSFRGVFRLLAGDLDRAVTDLTASLKLARRGATLTLGLRAYFYLALAQYLAGARDDVLLTAEQGFSAAGLAGLGGTTPAMPQLASTGTGADAATMIRARRPRVPRRQPLLLT